MLGAHGRHFQWTWASMGTLTSLQPPITVCSNCFLVSINFFCNMFYSNSSTEPEQTGQPSLSKKSLSLGHTEPCYQLLFFEPPLVGTNHCTLGTAHKTCFADAPIQLKVAEHTSLMIMFIHVVCFAWKTRGFSSRTSCPRDTSRSLWVSSAVKVFAETQSMWKKGNYLCAACSFVWLKQCTHVRGLG